MFSIIIGFSLSIVLLPGRAILGRRKWLNNRSKRYAFLAKHLKTLGVKNTHIEQFFSLPIKFSFASSNFKKLGALTNLQKEGAAKIEITTI